MFSDSWFLKCSSLVAEWWRVCCDANLFWGAVFGGMMVVVGLVVGVWVGGDVLRWLWWNFC